MKKIELTDRELEVLKQQLNGEFDRVLAPEEDKDTLMIVIDKAENLMHELKAYKESGDDLMAWFYNKYKEQESIA